MPTRRASWSGGSHAVPERARSASRIPNPILTLDPEAPRTIV
jgi:hypothetical protein